MADQDTPEKNQDIPEVQNELSKVATNPKQSIIILLVIFVILILIFVKFFFYSGPSSEVKPNIVTPSEISKPIQDNFKNLPEIPKLPEAPKLEAPVAPPPPPPPVKIEAPQQTPLPKLSEGDTQPPPSLASPALSGKLVESDEEKKRREAKRKSSIILIAGVDNKKTPDQIAEEEIFKDRGNMAFVLARGKIIDAVLETAINSDLGGEVRAIISRDVFSERDQIILIPKGSKIFGNYTVGTDGGAYGRVAIIWTRIDLSNGYTINLDALSVDNLGRKGMQGRVDHKFKERLTNSVLLSAFNMTVGATLDKIVPPPIDSQAAATNTSNATNIQNIAQSVNNNGALSPDEKITQICAQVQNAMTDKTSQAFTSMTQACITANNSAGSIATQRLNDLMIAVNNVAATLIVTASTANVPTQAQNASLQAFKDISDTMRNMIQEQTFKPTTTIDQGTVIKIYVNKDYKFPQAVLRKSKLIK